MKELKDKTEFKRMVKNSHILFVQIGTETCVPCIAIKHKINEWIGLHKNVSAIYVPIEKFPDLAAEVGIFTVPTIIVYVEGKITIKESGYFGTEDIFFKTEKYMNMIE